MKKFKLIYLFILSISLIGCSNDDDPETPETPVPDVVAKFTYIVDEEADSVSFSNTSEGATVFAWDFGNGETSTEENPVKTFDPGTYTVKLTASNSIADSDEFQDDITVMENEVVFDSGLLDNGDFSSAGDSWIGNAIDVRTEMENSYNYANVETAGNAFDVNLSQIVAITQGTNYILTFDASSDQARTLIAGIGLNEDPWTNMAVEVDLTSETQTFSLQLSAADFGGANSRVLFDMGAAVGVVVIDNVKLVEGGDGSDSNTGDNDSNFDSGLLTNGDFENEGESWTGNALDVQTEGENSYNFANVEVAGNAYDVNIGQVVAITQDTNYTLTFDASSDQERKILAGIGLNEDPWTNTAPEVSLTTETQTFVLQLSASDFGGANSRVFFDMGAAVGIVVIDNVKLVEGGDGSDSNTDENSNAEIPDTAPAAPTNDAVNVISLFSDAYTDVTVTEWSASWDDASIEDIMVEGNTVKKITFGNNGGFLGIDFSANSFDATAFTHFHMDYWVADEIAAGQVLNPKWSNHANGEEVNAFEYTNPVTQSGQWVSLDIPITDFLAGTGTTRDNLAQFLIATSNTLDTVYVDNVYLYKN